MGRNIRRRATTIATTIALQHAQETAVLEQVVTQEESGSQPPQEKWWTKGFKSISHRGKVSDVEQGEHRSERFSTTRSLMAAESYEPPTPPVHAGRDIVARDVAAGAMAESGITVVPGPPLPPYVQPEDRSIGVGAPLSQESVR